jgi:hypothetical protein|tara:strand:- start:426 stop:680 length:255 start_codon:yes stop_codon:yes gene_type:complete
MLKAKDLATALEKIMSKSEVGKNARIQVQLPQGEYRSPDGFFDVVEVKLMQNNVLGHRETHRIIFKIYPSDETWAMGKPKKIIG